MKTIVIAPIFESFMSGRIWMGLDFQKVKNILVGDFNYTVQLISVDKLVFNLEAIPEGSAIFYATSYNKEYLQYTKDTISHIKSLRDDILLLPNLNQLLAFENKGYQEYLKKQLLIERVIGRYYGDINDLINDSSKMDFPFVLKLNEGALSSGVSLIRNEKELLQFQRQIKKRSLKETLALKLNRRNSFKRDGDLNPNFELMELNFKEFFQKRKSVVTQEFIPNLECDYKVLVFGNRYFVLKRATRKNDFRASGSGDFQWAEPPAPVLRYAQDIFKKMKIPFVSFDIGIDKENNCYLFEFQGTAFGPLTLTQSNKFYSFQNNSWKKNEAYSDLEYNYAYAIDYFLKNNYENS